MLAIDVLGPLTVSVDGRPLAVSSAKLRVLLVVLAMDAGSPVPVDRLVDALWGDEDLPNNARRSVQLYVTRLRNLLPRGSISTGSAGYRLCVDAQRVDALRFTRLLDAAAHAPDVDTERRRLTEALGWWRGDPFDDVPSAQVAGLRAPLVERYLAAVERDIDLDLLDGRHGGVVPRLSELTASHPLRESLWVRLLTALDRCGRQAEALLAYDTVRRRLADELGIDPGPELQKIYADLLGGPPPPHRSARVVVVPRQLPADIPGFTGRAGILKALDALVDNRDLPETNAVVIAAIAGMAGIGKTALAVHWAHRVAGDFEDGQLYVNLQGYAQGGSPLEPARALAGLLGALGLAPGEVPTEVEVAAALYRSLLAGRRTLVLLDNASSAEQVRPLLPGSPTCAVLITSRDRLGGLVATHGARRLTLDVLAPDEGLALLEQLLGAGRIAAERPSAADLVETCARLPLALRIAAANLANQPAQSIAGYLADLTADDRLSRLAVAGEPHLAVQVAFDASYQRLPPATRRVFRLLGCVPGPEISVPAAAALAELPPETAAGLLDELSGAHLVESRGVGRFGLHDLLRRYARERVEREAAAALARLFAWYLRGTDAAGGRLYPDMSRLPVPASTAGPPVTFDSDAEAMAWLDAERANLVAAVRHAAEHGSQPVAWLLADALRGYFWLRRHCTDWLVTARAGLAAATDAGDDRARAATRLSLGTAHHAMGRHPEAIEHYTAAHDLAERAGWSDGRATSLGNLGGLHSERGDFRQAADHHARSLAVARQAGRFAGEATGLLNLGVLLNALGRQRESLDHFDQALALYRRIGSRDGEALIFCNLGFAYRELGRLDTAHRHLTRSLAVMRELGDRYGETHSARGLAIVHRDAGRHAEALEFAEAAAALASETGDRNGELKARVTLASVHLAADRAGPAAEGYRRALDVAREIGASITVVTAELGLAAVGRHSGRFADAADHAREALTLAARAGLRLLEGRAHTSLAAALRALDRPDRALDHAQRALRVHRETEYRLGEAHTLQLLGSLAHDAGDLAVAVHRWRDALDLFTDIGSPDAAEVRRLLDANTPPAGSPLQDPAS
jgi:DNA-binding SARP family transcriptional activator/tetratricopeptide (TPR) repeat protein